MKEHTASGEDASRDSRRRETDRLFRECRRAGALERRDLLDEVVCLNMEVARDLARRYRGRGVPDDDLEQVAYLGLVKAVRGSTSTGPTISRATPSRRSGARCAATFETTAGWCGLRGPSRSSSPRSTTPRRSSRSVWAGRPDQATWPRTSGWRSPGWLRLWPLPDASRPSLSADRGLGTSLLLDTLGTEDPDLAAAEVRTMLHPLLVSMSCRERELVRLRFVQGLTQAEVGQEIGVTQSQVSRMRPTCSRRCGRPDPRGSRLSGSAPDRAARRQRRSRVGHPT